MFYALEMLMKRRSDRNIKKETKNNNSDAKTLPGRNKSKCWLLELHENCSSLETKVLAC